MTQDLIAYKAERARLAQKMAAAERPASAMFFSVRGGQLRLGDLEMPGNQVAVIIIDALRLNTFYQGKFDEKVVAPPTCYAIAREEADMAPHPTMQASPEYFKPESDRCATCPQNKWGSAAVGRGKACQNRRELVLLPAGQFTPRKNSRDFDLQLFTDPSFFRSADAAHMRLPVTSGVAFATYVQLVAGQFQAPVSDVVTRVSLEPHVTSQYQVKFEVLEPVSDDVLAAILERVGQARSREPRGFTAPEAGAVRR
jgi:hypothetical protein